MKDPDVRWKQRFSNYEKALFQLGNAVELSRQRPLSDLERQGLIQEFEFTHELAWNVLKDYLEYQGFSSLVGSRDATREAFRRGLIEDGEGWMEMIADRNMTSHTYKEEVADEICGKVIFRYHQLFVALQKRFTELADAD